MGVNAVTQTYDFTAGQVLTAAQMDNVNCGIPVFATTVTRDAAFGGTGEKVLAQGQYAYIEASNTLQVYNGSAWTDVVSTSAWTTYTPTVTSSGGTITTVGAVSGAYQQIGKTVFAYVSIVITTVGTATGQLRFTLPITSATNMTSDTVMGSGRDSGVSAVQLQILKASNTLAGVLQYTGASVFPLGNGVTCKGLITYEAA